jgi:peptidoglycan-associated lipoprotein
MKIATFFLTASLFVVSLVAFTGCRRNYNEITDDTKTAGRHMHRGFRALGGKHGSSRQVQNRDEFYSPNGMDYAQGDFIPLEDYQNSNDFSMGDSVTPPPRETPGDPGSSVPGIQAFRDPSTIPGLANIFQNIQFEYNSNLVKGQANLDIIHRVADYLRSHPNAYIFAEGHADERGPEAYNLALGSRRSNAVRNMLISEGVNPDNIFTISYGKERPIVLEHHEEAWSQNRRVEFKIYQR